MPITSSGQIALITDIEAEFDQTGSTDISLFQARDDAGLDAGEVAMTDFYGLASAVAPTVTVQSSSSVSSSGFTANGNVTADGGASVTERGFYIGTSTTATSNTKYTVSGTTGAYTYAITGLSSSTTYYVFAFATTSAGTTITSYVSTTTSADYSILGVTSNSFSHNGRNYGLNSFGTMPSSQRPSGTKTASVSNSGSTITSFIRGYASGPSNGGLYIEYIRMGGQNTGSSSSRSKDGGNFTTHGSGTSGVSIGGSTISGRGGMYLYWYVGWKRGSTVLGTTTMFYYG
jgi:hypothetical protein